MSQSTSDFPVGRLKNYGDPKLITARVRKAREIADRGGSFTTVARAYGISVPGTWMFLQKHASGDLLKQLKDNASSSPVNRERRIRTLRDSNWDIAEAAKRLGMDYHALYLWIYSQCGKTIATRRELEDELDDQDPCCEV